MPGPDIGPFVGSLEGMNACGSCMLVEADLLLLWEHCEAERLVYGCRDVNFSEYGGQICITE